MAKKYELITELYSQTLTSVFSDPQHWMAFLRSACHNYRLSFDDLLLVYAQRPDATAVLPIDGANGWNRLFGRWVNRDSTGIAVFDRAYTQGTRLKYYFDISDTHGTRLSRPVPLWTATPEDAAGIIEALENRFGPLLDNTSLAQALLSAAQNVVEDNLADYLAELLRIYKDTDLVWLTSAEVETVYKELLQNSVGYLLLIRCGVDANAHFSAANFEELPNFNTPEAMHCIGVAARDIAETLLLPIARAVRSRKMLESVDRTFEQSHFVRYAEYKQETPQTERRDEDGTELHDAGRLPPAEPGRARAAGNTAWEVRIAAADVSAGASKGPVHDPADQRQADGAPRRDRAGGAEPDGADRDKAGESRGRNGGTESPQPDEMGRPDEQLPTVGGGDHPRGTDLQLTEKESFTEKADSGELPAFSDEKLIMAIVANREDDLKYKKQQIELFFSSHPDMDERAAYLQSAYPQRYTEVIVDDIRAGYVPQENGLLMWEGAYLSRTKESVFSWGLVAEWVSALIEKKEYFIKAMAPPDSLQTSFYDPDFSVPQGPAGQTSLFPRPQLSQQIIDEALCVGANDPSSRLIICAYLMKDKPLEENARFLREHYGENGAGFYFGDRKISVWYNAEGIRVDSGETAQRSTATILSWEDAAKRIRELLDLGRYMPQGEIDRAAEFEKMRLADDLLLMYRDIDGDNKEIYFLTMKPAYEVHGGFPEMSAAVKKLLEQPDSLEALADECRTFINAYGKDRDILRFHHYRPKELLQRLTDLQREPLTFTAAEGYDPQRRFFISGDELDKVLRGSTDYRLAVYSFYRNNPDKKIREKYLKDYHGEHSGQYSGNDNRIYTSKGLLFSHGSISEPYAQIELSWAKVEKRISELISSGKFISEDDRAAMPGYEKHQLARAIRTFFDGVPQEQPRPYPYGVDYQDGIEVIQSQLDDTAKVEEIYRMMLPVWESTAQDDRRYPQRKRAFENLAAFRNDTFSLFGEVKAPKAPKPPAELPQPTEPLSPAAESPVPVTELPAAAASAKHDTDADLEQAKELINAYCIEEFDQEADFSNLSYVDLAYSTTEESDLPIQIYADLTASKLVYTVDGETVREISCESLSELHKYLANLDFDGMIADAEEAFAQIQQEQEPEQESEQESPAESSAEAAEPPAEPPAEEEQLRLKSIVIDLTPHSERDSNESLIGRRLVMDNRTFEVESISDFSGDVSLRDVTFESSVGIPITRIEKIGTVQQLLAQAEKEIPPEKKSPLALPAPRRRKASPFTLHPEIPAGQRSNYRIMDDHFAEGGAKTKFHNNLAAIRTLQQIEAENRLATPEEQETLARYVGWGGLPQAFDENNEAWAKESAELRALLPDAEYRAARATTLNAHYTSPTVIKAIYKAIENMGFRSGNVLEPSCGIGNFFGLVPESMAGAKLYGVELDSVTGRIARQLYQNNRIAVQGFESADLPDSFFDLAVGNVPFGNYSLPDKRYDKHRFLIHDYFFAKTLDKVRPGGIIAFVTSKGTMDKKDPSVRRYLAQRAELVGAIRLPNNAFLANAGTQVTTDILFLQKREKMIEANPEWLHLGETETGVPINQYFLSHPEMVLGEMVFDESMYGNKAETSCHPFENADLAELLDKAVQNIHAEYIPYEPAEIETEEDEAIPADPSVRNFSYTEVDGELFYRENSLMFPVKQSLTGQSRIRGMLAIRDCVRRLIACQTENTSDQEITGEQARLNQLYDAFTAKYGLLNSRANSAAFSADSSFPLLCALEVLDENGNLERKADMFTKRTIQPYVSVDRVDTASEALAVSIGEKARVDLRFMASLMDGGGGKDETIEQIKRELAGVIFRDPETYVGAPLAGWQTADAYLSGRVKEKLASAKLAAARDPAYAVNVTALERVQPKDLTAGEISVRLGTTWVPAGIIEQFIYELLATPAYHQRYIKVSYSKTSGEWNVSEKSRDRSNVRANNTFGTKRINAYKIIEQSLNLRDVRIFDTIQTEQGERRVLNKKETAIAQDKQDAIRQKFKDWIWTDPKRREFLCRLYNDRFNSIRPREYDGQHIRFVGMNPAITLRTHQRNAIARALYGGNALFGHVVGAGKSFEMIATAMEAKRLGLSSKSMFVVPNNIIGDFAADFLKLYPSANILVTTKRDFEKQNRKKFCARIATGDYDGVIIGHSQFEKIPLSAERQIAMLERQIDELMQGIEDAKEQEGARFNIKQMEKSRKNLEAKLKRLMEAKERDDTVTFEELGIDRLFVDEADMFKNLFLYTKMRNVGGISQTEAQKSSDLFMKCQYMDELTGGKGVVFATGTPVSNSMAELYTMQRYLQYSTLERMELLHFDSWAAQFGETVTTMELKPEGSGFQQKTRFSNFYNLPELMTMFKEVADIQTADMLNLPVPKANFHTVVCKPSEIQKEMVEALGERAEQVRNGEVDANEDNMLLITNDGRKLALDQRLMNPMLPDFEESKVNVCADNIYRIWERTSENRLTQLVFCDLSTPKNDGTFSVYNDLLDKLTGRGIPAEEIAFVHSANNEAQKKELFAKVRKGTIRVLLGSTFKMGAGTNCQDRLVALHDLDCPWRPRDLEQRSGRIIRQGNLNPEIDIYRYVTEGTFDAYLYQMIENKQRFISQVFTSKAPARVMQEIDDTALSYAEIKALATGNPLIIEHANLETEVNKLKVLYGSHLSQKYELEDRVLRHYPQEISSLTEQIAGCTADIALRDSNTPTEKDTFPPMRILDVIYTEKAKAGKALIEACKKVDSSGALALGTYRGFAMSLSFEPFSKEYRVALKGTLSHSTALGEDVYGNLTRIDNLLNGLESKRTNQEVQLANTRAQMQAAKDDAQKPFAREEELQAKSKRLAEITKLLKLDEQDRVLLDDGPDAGDDTGEPAEKKKDTRER